MALTQSDCEIVLSAMSVEEQAHFLLILGHELTVVGREADEFQGPGVTNARLLRDLNEIHHRIYSPIRSLGSKQAATFPPDALASWVTAEGKPNLQGACLAAFERSLAHVKHRT